MFARLTIRSANVATGSSLKGLTLRCKLRRFTNVFSRFYLFKII